MNNPIITIVTNNINEVFALMLQNPVIADYIHSHELINRAITNNACYQIVYDDIDKAVMGKKTKISEYSCAMKSHFRKSGNQMSGKWKSSYASLLA